MKKNFKRTFGILILVLILFIVYRISINYVNFQKVYNSYEDKKLAHKIEKKLAKLAKKVKKTKKPLSINLGELTEDQQIDKICFIGPYNLDITETMGVDWKQSKLWQYNVVNHDGLFSIFLIYKNNVIPIKIKRSNIINYEIKSSCTNSINNVKFELMENNSSIYLKVKN